MSGTYSEGDLVTYDGKLAGKTLRCKIIKVMPVDHDYTVRNYRIRDAAEAFDRVVPEFTLTRIEPTATDQVFKS